VQTVKLLQQRREIHVAIADPVELLKVIRKTQKEPDTVNDNITHPGRQRTVRTEGILQPRALDEASGSNVEYDCLASDTDGSC
jgi:hypothetical protein